MRYGSRVLALAKGKTAAEVAANELVPVLGLLKKAVELGELDAQTEAVSVGVRMRLSVPACGRNLSGRQYCEMTDRCEKYGTKSSSAFAANSVFYVDVKTQASFK